MCCSCCTTLKVAATWGAGIHVAVGIALLIRFYFVAQKLDDFMMVLYLVYISLFFFFGLIILLGVQKEVSWLLRLCVALFVLVQIYGLVVRLMIQIDDETVFQRISTLFVAVLMTLAYTFVLILYSRKLVAAAAQSRRTNKPPSPSQTLTEV